MKYLAANQRVCAGINKVGVREHNEYMEARRVHNVVPVPARMYDPIHKQQQDVQLPARTVGLVANAIMDKVVQPLDRMKHDDFYVVKL